MSVPPCPRCGTNREVNNRNDGLFYCDRCKGLFDNDPNEGGDHADHRPDIRIEREERRQERDRERARNRFNRR